MRSFFPALSPQKTEVCINIVDSDFSVEGQVVLKGMIRRTESSRLCHSRKRSSEGIRDTVE